MDKTGSHAFDLLDERVRRWVWEQQWDALRDVQESAIPAILAGNRDVLLSASTASGKTEAAFLPICTRLARANDERGADRVPTGIQVLYVSPLKALINDQFGRLDSLCERLEIPVHRWHGDVSQSAKRRLLERPSGILLITPESLEALFVRRGTHIPRLFGGLAYIVIDEIHAFIGGERGRQLQSLLHRVDFACGRDRVDSAGLTPRIGLSATLSDLDLAAAFLRPGGDPDTVLKIESRSDRQDIQAQIRGYKNPPAIAPAELPVSPPAASSDEDSGEDDYGEDSDDEPVKEAIAAHLYRTLRGGHHLVFANARQTVEDYTDRLSRMCAQEAVACPFVPHHGSLSREIREDAEARLKDESRPATALCTSTLELGIDIGAVESVAQIGVPPSVAGLRQRLGRSGRRAGAPSRVRIYITEEPILPKTPLPDLLRAQTVQATVMLQLLVDGWCEPPEPDAPHLSTLVQQTLSVIAERGGCAVPELWTLLCGTGPFRQVNRKEFAEFLRALHKSGIVAQMEDGLLLAGATGERLLEHYSFYSAFTTPEEYRLVAQGHTLGTLPIEVPLPIGSYLIYAGKRWRIVAVDDRQRVIDLLPARGGKPPVFGGEGATVSGPVRRAMRAFYAETTLLPFLDSVARDLVGEGRDHFRRFELDRRQLVSAGEKGAYLFLWADDRVNTTLLLEFHRRGIKAENDGICLLLESTSADRLRTILEEIAVEGLPNPLVLAEQVPNTITEKYDIYLTPELRRLQYAARRIRTDETLTTIRDIIASP